MDKRILYKQENGVVAVVIPADCGLTVDQIAKKDVPTGFKYKIVDVSDVPSDRTFREAWTIDDSELTDGVGEEKKEEEKKEEGTSEWLQ